MIIHGLQKMTLLDFPGHVACTVFLSGCDFRCPFCHNFDLACGKEAPLMDDVELLKFLKTRTELLDGVAFTGGEPCLHKELPELIKKIRELGFPVKVDTNGYHPEMIKTLIDGYLVDYFAMDIKNSREKYARTCGTDAVDMGNIEDSIELIKAQAPDYEFRTTCIDELHEVSDFEDMGSMIKGAKRYFLQAFTDRESVPFGNLHAPEYKKMLEFSDISRKYADIVEMRGMDKNAQDIE